MAGFAYSQNELFEKKIGHGNIKQIEFDFDSLSGLWYCKEPVAYADLTHWARDEYFEVDPDRNELVVKKIREDDPEMVKKARQDGILVPATTDRSLKYTFAHSLLEALAACHKGDSPEIHGDIKPDNVIIERRKNELTIKIADFDVHTNLQDLDHEGITRDPMIAGHRGASPETMTVSTGATHSNPKTTKDDVFAMGKTLFYLFTGLSLNQFEGRKASKGSRLEFEAYINKHMHSRWIEGPYCDTVDAAVRGNIEDGVELLAFLENKKNPPIRAKGDDLADRVTLRANADGVMEPVDPDKPVSSPPPPKISGKALMAAGILAMALSVASSSSSILDFFKSDKRAAQLDTMPEVRRINPAKVIQPQHLELGIVYRNNQSYARSDSTSLEVGVPGYLGNPTESFSNSPISSDGPKNQMEKSGGYENLQKLIDIGRDEVELSPEEQTYLSDNGIDMDKATEEISRLAKTYRLRPIGKSQSVSTSSVETAKESSKDIYHKPGPRMPLLGKDAVREEDLWRYPDLR